MLTRWPALLGLLLMTAGLGMAQETPATPAVPDAESPRQLYEQVNALLIVRGLGMSQEQVAQILPLVYVLREARRDAREALAELWTNSGEALQTALAAAVAGRASPEALAPAQAALAEYEAISAGLLQAHRNAATQLALVLSPAQEALYETLSQFLVREQAQGLLGGAPSVQHYFVAQMDLLRSLSFEDYRLVRFWQAQRLAMLLRPAQAVGFAQVRARLLEAMDSIYLLDDSTYLLRRPYLPEEIAVYLGLPSAVRPTYFQWDQMALFLTSDQTPAVLQYLLEEPADPVREPDPAVEERVRLLEDAAGRARVLLLARTMDLTAGQMAAMQPLVQQAAAAVRSPAEAEAATLAGQQTFLRQFREALLAAPEPPAELTQAWLALRENRQSQQLMALGTATDSLVQTRDFLTVEQSDLVAWPPALAGGANRQAQLQELRYIAGQMAVGLIFLDRRRSAAGQQAFRGYMLPARTITMLNAYVPPDSPYRRQAEDFLLDMVREGRSVPAAAWEATWPGMVTDLMVALGAVPGPGAIFGPAPVESWSTYFGTLTDPAAPGTLAAVVANWGG